ncbi:MAG: hypothetical protein NVS2B9_19400 [Myxococcales bacterium]
MEPVVPPLAAEPLETAPPFCGELASVAAEPIEPLPVVAEVEFGAVPVLFEAWLSLVSLALAVVFGVVALAVPAVAWPLSGVALLAVPLVRPVVLSVLAVPFVSVFPCAHAASPMSAAAASVVPRLSFMDSPYGLGRAALSSMRGMCARRGGCPAGLPAARKR